MPRILLIGVDGLSPRLVGRWVEDGYLPHLGEMLTEGASGPLRSTPEFSSPQAWPSLMTGVNPAKHGIFSFLQRVPGTYDVAAVSAADIRVPTIFQILSELGARVASLNIPCTYPMAALNGIGVAGWLCPSLQAEGASWPPELADELRRRFGRYPFHAQVKHQALRGRYRAALETALSGLRKKSQIGKLLYQREAWDLFAITFVETDALQHYFWHLCDPKHPKYDRAQVRRWGNPVLDAYQVVDEIIGQWRELVGEDTVIIIASDHGAGIYNRGRTYIPNLLRKAGLTMDKQGALSQLRAVERAGRQKIGQALHHLLPKGLKMRLYDTGFGQRVVESFFSRRLTDSIDWQQTRAYSYYWETAPWVNLEGREPEGVVKPGRQYEEVCEQLVELISSSRDEATGQPAADRVFRREEMYDGPNLEIIPDVGVWWNQEITLEGPLVADWDGQHIAARPAIPVPGITGGHAPEGAVIVFGPGVRAGADVANARIEDIAPTILRLLGQPAADYMDGGLLQDCFTDSLVESSMSLAEGTRSIDQSAVSYSQRQQQVIIERLRNLGYM